MKCDIVKALGEPRSSHRKSTAEETYYLLITTDNNFAGILINFSGFGKLRYLCTKCHLRIEQELLCCKGRRKLTVLYQKENEIFHHSSIIS